MKFFLVLLSSPSMLALPFSLEALEESYPFRDIQKPIANLDVAEKIIVLSITRTGSTLTYMIFQYLFEDTLAHKENFNKKVVKTHDIKMCDAYCTAHPNTYIIIPIRSPIDSFISKLKVLNSLQFIPDNKEFINAMVQAHIIEHLNLWKFIQKYQNGKLLIVRYEDFQSDLNVLVSSAEQEFQITISETEKNNIASLFSQESILEISKRLAHFIKQDPITGIHGNHILKDQTPIKKYVSDEHLKQIQDQLRPITQLYGYE